jgi:hypothetical protein
VGYNPLTNSETFEVAAFAHDYIHKHGASDPVFQLYFGNKPEAYPSAVGVYDAILNSDKTGVLFRCDDPDKVGYWWFVKLTSELRSAWLARPLPRRERDFGDRHL